MNKDTVGASAIIGAPESFRSDAPPPKDPLGEKAEEMFRERIKRIEAAKGIRFLAGRGAVEVSEGKWYVVSFGAPAVSTTKSPKRNRALRRLLEISGRQWTKFRKLTRRYEKAKKIEASADGLISG